MWTEIVDYIEKVGDKDNLDELMCLYLTYIATINPLKRVKQCQQYKIALDLIEIINTRNKYKDDESLSILHNTKYKSKYIRDKIKTNKDMKEGISGIDNLIMLEKKNIELVFILKNVENSHDLESVKIFAAIIIALLSIIFTVKTSADIIPSFLNKILVYII